MVDNPFTAFIDLVTYDASVRALRKNREQAELDLQNLNSLDKNLEQERIKAKERLISLRRDVDVLERELHELDEGLSEKQRRLSLVNTPKEYFSLQQEIEALEKTKQEADDTLLALWNTLEQEQHRYQLLEKKVIGQRQQLEHSIKEQEKRIAFLDEEITSKLHKRAGKEKMVPAEWLEKYNTMLKRVENPVVAVENASCSACFYPISSQDLAALKRHKLLECKGCYRMLYHI
jgi:predicted  nucleic acid-binding Zn-ribbon protein